MARKTPLLRKMVRKQVYIEPHHEAFLKQRAAQLGITEAELIRRAIDGLGRQSPTFHPDLHAWEDLRAFIEDRRRLVVPQTGRQWRRDELYTDREERLARVAP